MLVPEVEFLWITAVDTQLNGLNKCYSIEGYVTGVYLNAYRPKWCFYWFDSLGRVDFSVSSSITECHVRVCVCL
jgi:hypothetical protein